MTILPPCRPVIRKPNRIVVGLISFQMLYTMAQPDPDQWTQMELSARPDLSSIRSGNESSENSAKAIAFLRGLDSDPSHSPNPIYKDGETIGLQSSTCVYPVTLHPGQPNHHPPVNPTLQRRRFPPHLLTAQTQRGLVSDPLLSHQSQSKAPTFRSPSP